MPKVKKRRQGYTLDMTAMVDVAFLLLTFFMLTTQFRPPEPIPVSLPAAHSDNKLPDSDILTVSVGKDNVIFLGVDSQPARIGIFDRIIRKELESKGVTAAAIEDSLQRFKLTEGIQVQPNDLEKMIVNARLSNPRLRPVIKADIDADYKSIDEVIKAFKKTNMPVFNLITNLEKG
jgi:biopolymer transport protein ExbD